jgi:protein-S-isoprenylcysteine O-methyltransferase Ste14
MKLLTDWGFSKDSWKGDRGEYWVLAQALLLLGFVLLPVYGVWPLPPTPWVYGLWAFAGLLGLAGGLVLLQALFTLGGSLTPLPHPRDDSTLVQSGLYAYVRHPVYLGVICLAWAVAIATLSLTHLAGAIAFFLFFDAKSRREERWLVQRYSEYSDYRKLVNRLIPGVY